MAKVLISIDERLLRRIDNACQRIGLSRSAYLARLASADLGHPDGPGSSPEARAALTQLDELFAEAPASESTDMIRLQRDSR
jgi:hypothetical protein